jgi:hypothetical protein
MSAARNADQSDFDLERFINMFDEALTSRDPRVIDALRGLMMMVTLTRSETRDMMEDRRTGPLRRLVDDVNALHNRISRQEEILSGLAAKRDYERYDYKRAYRSEPDIALQRMPESLVDMLKQSQEGLR